jgi:uncharacterized protein YgiM (DUF1202 family)
MYSVNCFRLYPERGRVEGVGAKDLWRRGDASATSTALREAAQLLHRRSFASLRINWGEERIRVAAALFVLLVACGKADVDTTDTREPIAIQYVGGAEMPVHQRADDKSIVVTRYKAGESVPVLSKKGDWAEVRTAMGSGWVHQKELVGAEEVQQAQKNPNAKFMHPPSPVTAPSAHGTIYIEADVNTDGDVTSTNLIENTTGSPDLAEKNIAALKRSKFYPILIHGERKPFQYYYRVDY